jgi:hypothetical protein
LASETNFGRTYGWFIDKDGKKIGELNYIHWDSDGQFWHDYSVTWETGKEIKADPDEWMREKLVLRSRKYPDVVTSDFLTSHKPDKTVSVRFASVPIERFEQDKEV